MCIRDRLEAKYAAGDNIGDGHIKVEVAQAIDELIAPIREKRAELAGEAGDKVVLEILREHAARANAVAEETLARAKAAMRLDFFGRELRFPRG